MEQGKNTEQQNGLQLCSGRAFFERLQKSFQPHGNSREHSPEYSSIFTVLPHALMELIDEGAIQAWHSDPDIEFVGIFTARDSNGQKTDVLYEVGALRLALQRAVERVSPRSFMDMMESFDHFAGKLAAKASAAFDPAPMPVPGYGKGIFQGYGNDDADEEMKRIQSRYPSNSARHKAFNPC